MWIDGRTDGSTDRETDTLKLRVVFFSFFLRNFANVSEDIRGLEL